MAKLANRLSGDGGSIFKNIIMLTAGTLAGRAIDIISLPILTRLFPPESFGLLAVFTAIVSLVVPIATFYATAIPLPKRDQFALNVVALSTLVLLFPLGLSSIILFVYASPIFALLNLSDLTPYWPILIVGIAGTSLFRILVQWGIRRKAFTTISKATAYQAGFGAATKLALGWSGFTTTGLIIGGVVQSSTGAFQLAKLLLADALRVSYRLSLNGMIRAMKRFADFPLWRLPSQLLMAFTSQALLLFSASLFDITIAGQLSLAVSILALPVSLLGNNIGHAYYGEITAIGRKDLKRIHAITISVVKRLFLVSAVPAIVLLFFAPVLFSFVFGDEWTLAGEIAALSAPYVVASFVSVPVVHVLNVLGHQKYYLRINLTRALWTVGLFLTAGFWNWEPMVTIGAYYAILTIHLTAVLITILRLLSRQSTPLP